MQTDDFVPPAFDEAALSGTPDVPGNLGYSPVKVEDAFSAYICGTVILDGNTADVYFTSDSKEGVSYLKRLVAMLLCVLIISMLAVPCYAAAWSEEKTGAVYAKYMDAITDVYKGKVSDGSATTTLPDSIAVTVSGNVDDSLTLVVKPVLQEETEAFGWFETCLHSVGTNIYPLDVYFVDGDGNKVQPRGDITVTIALPDGYKDPVVCFIDADGKVTVLDSSVGGGTISFTTNHNSYYAVVEKSTVPPNPSDSHSPQTGDNSDMMLWLVLLLVSGGVLTTTGITQKRKKNSVM